MEEFLKQYGVKIIVATIAAVLLLAPKGSFARLLSAGSSAIAYFWPGTTTTTTSPATVDIDQDTLEHQATMLLAARADRRKCPECKEAIKKYQSHWLDDNSRTEG